MSKIKSFILIFLCLFIANCLKENEDIIISIWNLSTECIGKKGTIALRANPYDKFNKDTTRKIFFQSKIYNGISSFDIDCGFWKAIDREFYIFCNVDSNIPAGNYTLDFTGIEKFNYQNYNVTLKADDEFKFEKLDKNYIDLYSEEQIINLEEIKDSYDLKFKVISYNQEIIGLSYFFLLNCYLNKDELICPVTKNDLGISQHRKEMNYNLIYFGHYNMGTLLPLVGYITIIDNTPKKIDVFIGIIN